MSIQTPLSVGEFLDKITILTIKSERIKDTEKLSNVHHELKTLQSTWAASEFASAELDPEFSELKQVNEALWDIEDAIRDKERSQQFDKEFIELARSVYITNDKRAELKKALNTRLGSELVEEKSYADYQANDS